LSKAYSNANLSKAQFARKCSGKYTLTCLPLYAAAGGRGAFGAQLAGAVTGRLNRRTGKQEAERGDKVFDLLKYDVPR
jgi:hypothetical protein